MYWTILLIWPLVNLLFSKEYFFKIDSNVSEIDKNKIIRNLISATHSIGSVLNMVLFYYTDSQLLRYYGTLFSITYFIWDSYLLIIKDYRSEFAFLIHHFISIDVFQYILLDYYNSKFVTLLVLYGELSNFPNYLIYHKIKNNNKSIKDNYNIKNWKHIQIVWFMFFRLFMYGRYLTSLYYLVDSYLLSFGCYTIYLMGIYWLYGQIKSLYRDYYVKTNSE